MNLPPYYWTGDKDGYVSPTYSISYTNFDLEEGVPEDELTVAFEADFHLPEETPESFALVEEPDWHDE